MANVIKINTASLNSDADSVATQISKIKKQMEKLKADKVALDAMWDGPSSEAFKAAFTSDINALDKFIKNLEKMNNYEKKAQKKYVSCENKVSGMVRAIRM